MSMKWLGGIIIFLALAVGGWWLLRDNTPTSNTNGTWPTTKRDHVFFIALDDNGKIGEAVGCGDSVVGIPTVVSSSDDPAEAGVKALLANHNARNGRFSNALANSRLTLVARTEGADGWTYKLSGTLSSGGVCDDPRIIAQLTKTAEAASGGQPVHFTVNDKPITTLLSGKGDE